MQFDSTCSFVQNYFRFLSYIFFQSKPVSVKHFRLPAFGCYQRLRVTTLKYARLSDDEPSSHCIYRRPFLSSPQPRSAAVGYIWCSSANETHALNHRSKGKGVNFWMRGKPDRPTNRLSSRWLAALAPCDVDVYVRLPRILSVDVLPTFYITHAGRCFAIFQGISVNFSKVFHHA